MSLQDASRPEALGGDCKQMRAVDTHRRLVSLLGELQSGRIRMKDLGSRHAALSLTWSLWDVKEPTPLFEKSRGR